MKYKNGYENNINRIGIVMINAQAMEQTNMNMSQNYENMILENLDRVSQPIIRFEIIQNLNLENLRLDLHHYEILHR